jgi:hypothetical protein
MFKKAVGGSDALEHGCLLRSFRGRDHHRLPDCRIMPPSMKKVLPVQ